MSLFSCFCCKPKAKSKAAVTLDPTSGDYTTRERAEDSFPDQSIDLEAIRIQLRMAQRQLGMLQQPVEAVAETVVGVIDIPLYESDGFALKNAGICYPLFIYDK